jgi:hypothetical protein
MTNQEQVYKIIEADPLNDLSHTHAINMAGKYIGVPDYAKMLLEKFDIRPETIDDNNVCSIGFSPRDNKWYGWSHRALYGFSVGSKVVKGDCAYVGATPEDLIDNHAEFFADISPESAQRHRDECLALDDGSGIRILHAPLLIPMAESVEDIFDDDVACEEVDIYEGKFTVRKCGRGEWTAETMEDAKQMAIDFANGVA